MVNNTRKIILGKNNIHIFVFYVTACYLNPQLVKFYNNVPFDTIIWINTTWIPYSTSYYNVHIYCYC